jgi:hypothetical protein
MAAKRNLEEVFENIVDSVQRERVYYERVYHHELMTIVFRPENLSFSISIFPKEECEETFLHLQQMVSEIFPDMYANSEKNDLMFSIQVHDTTGYKKFTPTTKELYKGFTSFHSHPYWSVFGKIQVHVQAIIEGEGTYSTRLVSLMSFWNLREISDHLVKMDTFGDKFEGATFFARRDRSDKHADDTLLDDESVLLSAIHDDNCVLLLCQGDFGEILM